MTARNAAAERMLRKRRNARADFLLRALIQSRIQPQLAHRQDRRVRNGEHEIHALAARNPHLTRFYGHGKRKYRGDYADQAQKAQRAQQNCHQVIHPRARAQTGREQHRRGDQNADQTPVHFTFTGTGTLPMTPARIFSAVILRIRASGLKTRRCASTGSAMRLTSSGDT